MDYSIIVDKSLSMKGQNWVDAKAAVKLLAPIVTEQDKDGISLYFFSDKYETHNNIKDADTVMELFDKNEPTGKTNMRNVL